jgi:hypothetical protein
MDLRTAKPFSKDGNQLGAQGIRFGASVLQSRITTSVKLQHYPAINDSVYKDLVANIFNWR